MRLWDFREARYHYAAAGHHRLKNRRPPGGHHGVMSCDIFWNDSGELRNAVIVHLKHDGVLAQSHVDAIHSRLEDGQSAKSMGKLMVHLYEEATNLIQQHSGRCKSCRLWRHLRLMVATREEQFHREYEDRIKAIEKQAHTTYLRSDVWAGGKLHLDDLTLA